MNRQPRKPRWRGEYGREQRAERGGVEIRAEYRGNREDRRFGVGVIDAPTTRATTTTNATAATITGNPIVYSTPYSVNDRFGSFTEVVAPGAVSAILPKTDTRFLVEHSGLALARTSSGTLVLSDSPSALNCRAVLDPRSPTATEVILAVGRGDVNQMSIGMVVADDEWSSDMSHRTITQLAELLDVSVVSFPASPTTSAELLDVPEHLQPDGELGGPDGTQNAPMAVGGYMGGDGTGTRADKKPVTRNGALKLERDLLRVCRSPHLRSGSKYTQSQIDALGKKGQAFGPDKDGHYSYPVVDHEDVAKAVKAVGRGAADHDAIRKFIIGRGKAIGASHLIPDNWAADGSLKS